MDTSATPVTPPPSPPWGGALVQVSTAEGLLAPSRCACCMQPAGEPQRLETNGGPVIVVHYCSECHAHAAAARTRALAIGVASAFLGLGVAAATVLTLGSLQPALQSVLASLAAALPAIALLGRSPRPPHTTGGSAAWWRRRGQHGWALVCTHPVWGAQVAATNGASCDVTRTRPTRAPLSLLTSMAVAALAVPAAHAALGVEVRVLNRYAVPAVVVIDGRHRGVVEPSSVESPAAGLQLHLVAGVHPVQLIAQDGRVLADTTASFRPGVDHLIAASEEPVCFWVERTVYGRASAPRAAREDLPGPGPVWELPGTMHRWFAPNPPTSESDDVSSGGALLALRQGRCGSSRPLAGTPEP